MPPLFSLAATPTTASRGGLDARRLLNQLYEETAGQPMPPLLRHEHGKPYFSQGPLHCSITHTRTMAFCALSDGEIGLDAEQLSRHTRPALVRKVLSAQEYRLWQEAQEPDRVFLTLWTLKEATVKYTGDGLRGYPNHLNFDLQGPTLEGWDLHFRLWEWKNHVVALCAGVPLPEDLEIRRFF